MRDVAVIDQVFEMVVNVPTCPTGVVVVRCRCSLGSSSFILKVGVSLPLLPPAAPYRQAYARGGPG